MLLRLVTFAVFAVRRQGWIAVHPSLNSHSRETHHATRTHIRHEKYKAEKLGFDARRRLTGLTFVL